VGDTDQIEVDVLRLGVVALPDWHPRSADGRCVLLGAVVRHPDGAIVYDTGTGDDHPMINEMYEPSIVSLIDALNGVGVDERDVVAIVNSHLHFDHCGQNRALPDVPVWVQRSEYELVDAPLFTVADWARLPVERRRMVDGDATIADGVQIVATPGHTPGHQSLVIDRGVERVVLGGQCCYSCGEFDDGVTVLEDVHDESWHATALESIRRLHDLDPDVVHLAHDQTAWRKP